MKMVVQKFMSFAEADKADLERYRNMTPEERLQILLELIMPEDPSAGVIERSARIYSLGEQE